MKLGPCIRAIVRGLSAASRRKVGAACGVGAYFGFDGQTSLGYTVASGACSEGDATAGESETRFFIMGVAEVAGQHGGAIDQGFVLLAAPGKSAHPRHVRAAAPLLPPRILLTTQIPSHFPFVQLVPDLLE